MPRSSFATMLKPVMVGVAVCCLIVLVAAVPNTPDSTGPLQLSARHRSPTQDAPVTEPVSFDPHQTALVICDMWDKHWCKSATRRVAEMAPHINDLANTLRAHGVLGTRPSSARR